MQNLTAKKREFFENNFKERVGKPKDLWKVIESARLPNKSDGYIVGALAENRIVKHDTISLLKIFKCFYSNLAGYLLAKLSKLPHRYIIKFVSEKLSLSENFKLNSITVGYLFNI